MLHLGCCTALLSLELNAIFKTGTRHSHLHAQWRTRAPDQLRMLLTFPKNALLPVGCDTPCTGRCAGQPLQTNGTHQGYGRPEDPAKHGRAGHKRIHAGLDVPPGWQQLDEVHAHHPAKCSACLHGTAAEVKLVAQQMPQLQGKVGMACRANNSPSTCSKVRHSICG